MRTRGNYFDSILHVNWTFGSFGAGCPLAVSKAVGHPVTGVRDSQRGEGTLQFVVSSLMKEVAES